MMQIESTLNPNVLKFVGSKNLFSTPQEYSREEENINFTLANILLQFPFVESVLTQDDFVAILKNESVQWEDVQEELKEIIEEEVDKLSNKTSMPIEVYVEATPNPNTIKLLTNHTLFQGIAEAERNESTEFFPLADFLFQQDYIASVFVTDNYISLTKTEETDWFDYQLEIREIVADYLRGGNPIIEADYSLRENNNTIEIKKEFTDFENEIQQILEEYVKPAVASDGGSINLVEYIEESKTAKMVLQGACSGCPSSSLTLKNGIETLLKNYFPEKIENVEAING